MCLLVIVYWYVISCFTFPCMPSIKFLVAGDYRFIVVGLVL
jgi:hypothetical protein